MMNQKKRILSSKPPMMISRVYPMKTVEATSTNLVNQMTWRTYNKMISILIHILQMPLRTKKISSKMILIFIFRIMKVTPNSQPWSHRHPIQIMQGS